MFKYHVVNMESKAIVHFEGDLDIESTELIERELTPELLQYQDIQINFSGVPFVDSSGIGLLISMIKQLRKSGSCVVIVNLDPEVKVVFSLLQLPLILGEDVFVNY